MQSTGPEASQVLLALQSGLHVGFSGASTMLTTAQPARAEDYQYESYHARRHPGCQRILRFR